MERSGAGAKTIDEYLAKIPPEKRKALAAVRKTIRASAPRAVESISYGIPTYKQDGRPLIYFSAAKEHLTIHAIDNDLLEDAAKRGFATGRGSIRFNTERPIPSAMLTRIVKTRLARLREGANSYGKRKKR